MSFSKDRNSSIYQFESFCGSRKLHLVRATALRTCALGSLSSDFSSSDVLVLALTETADLVTRQIICQVLLLDSPTKVFICSNRKNLRFSIVETQKEKMSGHLNLLANLLEEHGSDMPKTIIFCNTLGRSHSYLFSELLHKVGKSAYFQELLQIKKTY